MKENRAAIRRVMVAVNVIDGAYDALAKKIGVKENTLTLLYALDDGRAHSQKEICEEWFLPKTTVNTIVKECVAAGYLTLGASSGKKEKEICLTEKGRACAGMALGQVYELEQRAMDAALGREDAGFIPALERLAANLKEEVRDFEPESGETL